MHVIYPRRETWGFVEFDNDLHHSTLSCSWVPNYKLQVDRYSDPPHSPQDMTLKVPVVRWSPVLLDVCLVVFLDHLSCPGRLYGLLSTISIEKNFRSGIQLLSKITIFPLHTAEEIPNTATRVRFLTASQCRCLVTRTDLASKRKQQCRGQGVHYHSCPHSPKPT